MKFSESELKVMQMLWNKNNVDENGEITASKLSTLLTEKYGWPKTSNYVYFGRLLEKSAITRRYPKYTMKALIEKEEMNSSIAQYFIDNSFGGSLVKFFSAFLSDKNVDEQDVQKLKELIDSYDHKKKKKRKE